eukprot:scaffold803_cov310-Pinguiococcus_pyrenoidosus.AAC.51
MRQQSSHDGGDGFLLAHRLLGLQLDKRVKERCEASLVLQNSADGGHELLVVRGTEQNLGQGLCRVVRVEEDRRVARALLLDEVDRFLRGALDAAAANDTYAALVEGHALDLRHDTVAGNRPDARRRQSDVSHAGTSRLHDHRAGAVHEGVGQDAGRLLHARQRVESGGHRFLLIYGEIHAAKECERSVHHSLQLLPGGGVHGTLHQHHVAGQLKHARQVGDLGRVRIALQRVEQSVQRNHHARDIGRGVAADRLNNCSRRNQCLHVGGSDCVHRGEHDIVRIVALELHRGAWHDAHLLQQMRVGGHHLRRLHQLLVGLENRELLRNHTPSHHRVHRLRRQGHSVHHPGDVVELLGRHAVRLPKMIKRLVEDAQQVYSGHVLSAGLRRQGLEHVQADPQGRGVVVVDGLRGEVRHAAKATLGKHLACSVFSLSDGVHGLDCAEREVCAGDAAEQRHEVVHHSCLDHRVEHGAVGGQVLHGAECVLTGIHLDLFHQERHDAHRILHILHVDRAGRSAQRPEGRADQIIPFGARRSDLGAVDHVHEHLHSPGFLHHPREVAAEQEQAQLLGDRLDSFHLPLVGPGDHLLAHEPKLLDDRQHVLLPDEGLEAVDAGILHALVIVRVHQRRDDIRGSRNRRHEVLGRRRRRRVRDEAKEALHHGNGLLVPLLGQPIQRREDVGHDLPRRKLRGLRAAGAEGAENELRGLEDLHVVAVLPDQHARRLEDAFVQAGGLVGRDAGDQGDGLQGLGRDLGRLSVLAHRLQRPVKDAQVVLVRVILTVVAHQLLHRVHQGGQHAGLLRELFHAADFDEGGLHHLEAALSDEEVDVLLDRGQGADRHGKRGNLLNAGLVPGGDPSLNGLQRANLRGYDRRGRDHAHELLRGRSNALVLGIRDERLHGTVQSPRGDDGVTLGRNGRQARQEAHGLDQHLRVAPERLHVVHDDRDDAILAQALEVASAPGDLVQGRGHGHLGHHIIGIRLHHTHERLQSFPVDERCRVHRRGGARLAQEVGCNLADGRIVAVLLQALNHALRPVHFDNAADVVPGRANGQHRADESRGGLGRVLLLRESIHNRLHEAAGHDLFRVRRIGGETLHDESALLQSFRRGRILHHIRENRHAALGDNLLCGRGVGHDRRQHRQGAHLHDRPILNAFEQLFDGVPGGVAENFARKPRHAIALGKSVDDVEKDLLAFGQLQRRLAEALSLQAQQDLRRLHGELLLFFSRHFGDRDLLQEMQQGLHRSHRDEHRRSLCGLGDLVEDADHRRGNAIVLCIVRSIKRCTDRAQAEARNDPSRGPGTVPRYLRSAGRALAAAR